VLPDTFFQVDPLFCAESLIGTELVWEKCAGLVVETEAYLVAGDQAAHTFNRPSARAFVERNKAGAAYIYFNYGVHWMLNVLVKGGPRDGLILIRAIEPRRGLSIMRRRRDVENVRRLCSGPGKLTQALAITKRHHEIDLSSDPAHCFRARRDPEVSVLADERIGISRAKDFPWRFTLRGSEFVSVPVRSGRPVRGTQRL
jgi:DNA-3-methyladenine glycosylase